MPFRQRGLQQSLEANDGGAEPPPHIGRHSRRIGHRSSFVNDRYFTRSTEKLSTAREPKIGHGDVVHDSLSILKTTALVFGEAVNSKLTICQPSLPLTKLVDWPRRSPLAASVATASGGPPDTMSFGRAAKLTL